MRSHHDNLVDHLKTLYAAAGGPITLPALLRLASPKIQSLLDNGVRWSWLGARILAVHRHPDAEISADVANLDTETVRSLVAEFSRQKRRGKTSKRRAKEPAVPSALAQMTAGGAEETKPVPDRQTRHTGPSPRAGIHAAAALNTLIGKLEP